ncbi:aminoglycoside 3'-phosphotransferase/choline kinase family protein [Bacillus infantis]|uniref:aminoglycoside 3'-phosphotransferase/choline kinase family protein n=1 Tax=Bacillus infantis TaxID=324767 RepID=UPI002FBDCA72
MEYMQKYIDRFQICVKQISNVPESFSSTVYKLVLNGGQTIYLKIPFSREKLERELEMLQLLRGHVPVPAVLDHWEGDEKMAGALLLEGMEGEPCTRSVDGDLAFQIGRHHAMLHNAPLPKAYSCFDPKAWREMVREKFEHFGLHASKVLPDSLLEMSQKHFYKSLQELPAPDGPCIIHMDFRPGNILVKDNNVAGIIDFESARSGSPEMDFSKINRDVWERHEGSREAYTEGYETIRPMIDLESILPFYKFFDAFCSVGWGQKRGAEKHREFMRENELLLASMF